MRLPVKENGGGGRGGSRSIIFLPFISVQFAV